MQIRDTALGDVKLLSLPRFQDGRGWFAEAFNVSRFETAGLPAAFAQDNQSFSTRGVLRGLHYQLRQPQGKLIRVLQGHICDVVVDVRRQSPEFGRWAAFDLRPQTVEGALEMLWIPAGFAHGFLVLSDTAEVLYKVTQPYDPGGEHTILWNDPDIAIAWPLEALEDAPTLSPKDAAGSRFRDALVFEPV